MIALRESLPTHARTSAAHLFLAVRFFTNRCKEVDPHVSAAQQTDGLLAALATVCVDALRFWMIFVGVDDVAVRLLAGSPSVPVMALRRDRKPFGRISVNPIGLQPSSRIGFIRRPQ